MRIKDKIYLNYDGLVEHGPINIVAFGDSVTHGAVGAGEIDYESVYWNRLRKKILDVRNYVPVNAINAGIGGITASASLARIERDVLSHNPDLIIVCFGLNDVNGSLETYLSSLRTIFEACRGENRDVIFMTPNMHPFFHLSETYPTREMNNAPTESTIRSVMVSPKASLPISARPPAAACFCMFMANAPSITYS